jgi:hypothetical protein
MVKWPTNQFGVTAERTQRSNLVLGDPGPLEFNRPLALIGSSQFERGTGSRVQRFRNLIEGDDVELSLTSPVAALPR